MKRLSTSNTVENPFVKHQNQLWQLSDPSSFSRPVSPPPSSKRKSFSHKTPPKTASVEAGDAEVEDHVAFFSEKLAAATKSYTAHCARIAHADWLALYERNQHAGGHHFVVHQHDHPVAGTHYDLRLQCNETSSISFAIMYGLPGDANSRRLNRNATETRVHNLWNHLIETASHSTGTMLIWDTGEYEVLPYRDTPSQTDTDGEDGSRDDTVSSSSHMTEPEKLHRAFQDRKVRLRLHGTRLPPGYTLQLRLTKDNYRSEQPRKPTRKRKRPNPNEKRHQETPETSQSDSDATIAAVARPTLTTRKSLSSLSRAESPPPPSNLQVSETTSGHSDAEEDQETIRLTNTYPGGAINTINSIHQRKWYLSLDRRGCGFRPTTSKVFGSRIWVRSHQSHDDDTTHTKYMEGRKPEGFEKFHVLGRDVERSVVTGRLAADILVDEGVEGYVPRGLWRAVVE